MKNHTFGKKKELKDSGKKTRLLVLEPTELLLFLMERMQGQSRNKIKSLLTRGQVLVDGEVVKQYNHLLRAGQDVTVNRSMVRGEELDKGLTIMYEDADLIIIDKPTGLLTIASDKEKELTAYHQLMNYVRKKF